jgi:hypothetical protein
MISNINLDLSSNFLALQLHRRDSVYQDICKTRCSALDLAFVENVVELQFQVGLSNIAYIETKTMKVHCLIVFEYAETEYSLFYFRWSHTMHNRMSSGSSIVSQASQFISCLNTIFYTHTYIQSTSNL